MVRVEQYDVIIVGAGLAGCQAAGECAGHGLKTLVLSKLHPLRSHSGAAQGGINASIREAGPELHIEDTLKGGAGIADFQAVQFMCSIAPAAVKRFEALGAFFTKNQDGFIAQRPFGGQSVDRTCYAADRTGLTLLQTSFEYAQKAGALFLDQVYVQDLLWDSNESRAYGVTGLHLDSGDFGVYGARAVICATGGYGRAFKHNSNAHANTGDALSIMLRKGIPLEDMEFVQFHPTGLAESGILFSEAARGEGGVLLNALGERFMERYDSGRLELAPRDIVSRAIAKEIEEGRGAGEKGDAVYLDLTSLPEQVIRKRLPELCDLAETFQKVDLHKSPVLVSPTAHYSMGGIPTDIRCRVRLSSDRITNGLYAAGECACLSVHGANRLGGNSLLEAAVFGREAGFSVIRDIESFDYRKVYPRMADSAKKEVERLYADNADAEGEGYTVADIRKRLREVMTGNAGIFRNEEKLEEASSVIDSLRKSYMNIRIQDSSRAYNTELQEALELSHMLDYSRAITEAAKFRTESRGAHWRSDMPERRDDIWQCHTLVYMKPDGWSVLCMSADTKRRETVI